MLIKTIVLCPKSWKLLCLLEENKIEYQVKQLHINILDKWPTIGNYNSDLSYILANFDKFIKNEQCANMYGFWLNIVDCNLIPEII